MSNRTLSLTLWGLGLLGTLLCMAVSAAGLRSETTLLFIITIIFLLFGFLFEIMNRKEVSEEEQERRHRMGQAQPLLEAYAAMDAYNAAILAGEPEDVLNQRLAERNLAAIEAILAYGDITVTQKQMAMVATAKASAAAKQLQESAEQLSEPEWSRLQMQTAALCCDALDAIRALTLQREVEE